METLREKLERLRGVLMNERLNLQNVRAEIAERPGASKDWSTPEAILEGVCERLTGEIAETVKAIDEAERNLKG